MKRTRTEAIIELLWDSLAKDPKDKGRRLTGWGTKTQLGLVVSVERAVAMPAALPNRPVCVQRPSASA